MAINAYCGRPGSGKSYSVVENVILPAIEQDRPVITNIPLNMDVLLAKHPTAVVVEFSKPEQFAEVVDLANRPELRGGVFVIDECWRYFPAGSRTTDLPPAARTFLAEHRHYVGATGLTTEICLVTQSLYQIAPFARELVDTTFVTSKLDKVGRSSSYRVDMYSGPVDLNRPNEDRKIRSSMHTYRSEVYQFYKSHTRNDFGAHAGKELKIDDRGSIWRSPFFRYGMPAVLLLGGYSFYHVFSTFLNIDTWRDPPPEPPPVADSFVPPLPQSFGGGPITVDQPVESDELRIVGVLHGDKFAKGVVIIRDFRNDTERRVPFKGNCSAVPNVPGDVVCTIDGERVTFFSGVPNRGTTL